MAKKSVIVVSAKGERVPFLRGILVQSLSEAGLSFEDAYSVAGRVREALAPADEIAGTDLRGLVADLLEGDFGSQVRRAYEAGVAKGRELTVRTPSRTGPFSVGLLSRYLEGCAIARDEALNGARTVQEILRRRDVTEIDSRELRRVIYRTLRKDCCAQAADRYLSRCLFQDSRQPLIILVGGGTGAGKSSVTADLAYLLDIPRTQSTDMMREIIRCYLAPHVVPTLGYSSFEAWRGLPEIQSPQGRKMGENPVIAGFLSQLGAVKVALEATISRAVVERQDMIVEGVHVMPSLLDLREVEEKAVVVPVTLAVTTLGRLESQLGRRSREQPERGSSRHKAHLEAIWDIQTYILDRSEQQGIPVIVNWTLDETVRRVLIETMKRIAERFPPDPAVLA